MSGSRDAGNRARRWPVTCPINGCRYVLTNWMVRGAKDTHILACERKQREAKEPPRS